MTLVCPIGGKIGLGSVAWTLDGGDEETEFQISCGLPFLKVNQLGIRNLRRRLYALTIAPLSVC